ncbi:UbiA family prenyltransferase [Pararhodobacter sp.]|uniref:UbiA family prenyltransferase n=1 Tax=Pararhodobacter sp. TaxID=2127056 RepID=UPI002FDEC194
MRGEDGREIVLVVDLDGTLIRSDMLLESFWSGFARDWRTPLRAVAGLTQGRAALKARLAACGAPDPATLPYNPAVLAQIRDWRAAGGRVALVTAADQRLAQSVADHLGLFDAVHGSDGTTNLKGPAKAAFLRDTFGAGGFAYIGDHSADLPVWEIAHTALTVGASPALRAQVDALRPGATHLAPPANGMPAALRAMRPHQWLKNLLVFLPMIAGHVFTLQTIAQGVLAFIAFGLVASSVYLLNDLLDLSADRAHPRKRARPLASGALPLIRGMAMVPVLLVCGMALALFLGPMFLLVLTGYYALTVAYSLWLKRKILVDICVLATLYTLRVIAGGVATDIPLSVWLLAFAAFFFLSLAAVKRQAELVDAAERGVTNASGRGYQVSDLPFVSQIAVSSGFVAVLVMMLYLNAPEVLARYSSPWLLWGACLVLLYWVARMVLLAHRGQMDDDPVVYATRDPVSRVAIALMAALVIGATLL